MIEVINNVIMVVLLEIHVFHLRLTLLYTVALFYLQFVNDTIIGKTLLVAGLFCFPRIFDRCSSFGNCKIRPMEQTQTQAGNKKRLASSSPEKDNKKLRMPCATLTLNLQRRTSWSAYGVRVSNTGNVQR